MLSADEFLQALGPRLGGEMGLTEWLSYDQQAVNDHGQRTQDDGPIHNDPAFGREQTPFGGTIVQGSLLLSSFTGMAKSLIWPDGDFAYRLNYGFNKVRIIQPVKTGQRFRGRFHLSAAEKKSDTALLVKLAATIEGEGDDMPAIAAEWLIFLQFNS